MTPELNTALVELLTFIRSYWWEIMLVIILAVRKPATGILLCILEVFWYFLGINGTWHTIFVLAVAIGGYFEHPRARLDTLVINAPSAKTSEDIQEVATQLFDEINKKE